MTIVADIPISLTKMFHKENENLCKDSIDVSSNGNVLMIDKKWAIFLCINGGLQHNYNINTWEQGGQELGR